MSVTPIAAPSRHWRAILMDYFLDSKSPKKTVGALMKHINSKGAVVNADLPEDVLRKELGRLKDQEVATKYSLDEFGPGKRAQEFDFDDEYDDIENEVDDLDDMGDQSQPSVAPGELVSSGPVWNPPPAMEMMHGSQVVIIPGLTPEIQAAVFPIVQAVMDYYIGQQGMFCPEKLVQNESQKTSKFPRILISAIGYMMRQHAQERGYAQWSTGSTITGMGNVYGPANKMPSDAGWMKVA